MVYKIMRIINEWDPIDLFPMAPADEYNSEIKKIQRVLDWNSNITIEQLGIEINKIFLTTFGDDVYTSSEEECKNVAKRIIEELNAK